MLFISGIQYYIPVKLYNKAGSIHLFKITGKVMMEKVKLNKHYIVMYGSAICMWILSFV